MSVYSLKLTRISFIPETLARFSTNEVFPTPGGPSINMGLFNWYARNTLRRLILVVYASKA